MRIFNITEAAKFINLSVKSLQRLDREGRLIANRTKTNRRFYTFEQLRDYLGVQDPTPLNTSRKIISYLRVSSTNQRQDLKNQRKVMEDFCLAQGYTNVEYIEEIGGGLNFNRPAFLKIIKEIENNCVHKLIIAHKDRLCRFGFSLIDWLAKEHACEILILNQEKLSPEQEMVQDLMTIIHCFSSRLYGLRNYRNSLKKALKDESSSQN